MPVGLYSYLLAGQVRRHHLPELMYDYDKAKEIARATRCWNSSPDVVLSAARSAPPSGRMLETVDFKQLQWPGHGVGDNQPYPVPRPRVHEGRGVRRLPVRPDRLLPAQVPAARRRRLRRLREAARVLPGMHYFRADVRGMRPLRPAAKCARRSRRSSPPPRKSTASSRTTSTGSPAHDAARLPARSTAASRRRPTTSSPTTSAAPPA